MRIPLFVFATTLAVHAHALLLADISNKDASSGLKEALTQGAGKAVAQLGNDDGFLGNPKVKIPLPENLQKIEGAMRKFGMGQQTDELVTAMNRAAEAAVPEAKTAAGQLGQADVGTGCQGHSRWWRRCRHQYFKRTTSGPLAEKFKPIVQRAIAKVKLAEKYDRFAGKGTQLGLVDANQATIEQYVTNKSLDGLYKIIADEEKALRQDPVGAASNIVQKVFGALK